MQVTSGDAHVERVPGPQASSAPQAADTGVDVVGIRPSSIELILPDGTSSPKLNMTLSQTQVLGIDIVPESIAPDGQSFKFETRTPLVLPPGTMVWVGNNRWYATHTTREVRHLTKTTWSRSREAFIQCAASFLRELRRRTTSLSLRRERKWVHILT